MKEKLIRIIVPLAVIFVLNVAGIIDLSVLPFHDQEFQVTLATVCIYLLWSVLEDSRGADGSRITLYAVLLVSVLDSFLLRLTVFSGFMGLRWTGVLILATGCVTRLFKTRPIYGRMGQMTGFALGLGSIAGIVISLFPGIPSALREDRS